MSIQAMHLQGAERTAQTLRQTQSATAGSGAVTAEHRTQDQVEISDQSRKLAASLSEPTVELQLSPARLREMLTAKPAATPPVSE